MVGAFWLARGRRPAVVVSQSFYLKGGKEEHFVDAVTEEIPHLSANPHSSLLFSSLVNVEA